MIHCLGFRHARHVRLRTSCSTFCACTVEASCHDITMVLDHAIYPSIILYIALALRKFSSFFLWNNSLQLISLSPQKTAQLPTTNMRFQFLAPLFSLFLLALGGVEDNIYIRSEIDFYNFITDAKLYSRLNEIFTPNATFRIIEETTLAASVQGISDIKALVASAESPGVVTQVASTTNVIALHSPFDLLGSAATANATTYITATYFGLGARRGQTAFLFAVYEDTFVKTGDFANYGGWKFSSRVLSTYVSLSRSPSDFPAR